LQAVLDAWFRFAGDFGQKHFKKKLAYLHIGR
jgi:hypothetical protein